jgi:hypothetical protein
MHRRKKLFCSVTQNCNLVEEFNGLVSKGVNRKIGPFYIIYQHVFSTYLVKEKSLLSLFFYLLIFDRNKRT